MKEEISLGEALNEEIQIEQAGNGLDRILGILEETGSLRAQLDLKVGYTLAETLCRVIQFGTLNQAGYKLLSSQKTGFFRKLFASLDLRDVAAQLSIVFDTETTDGFATVFEIQLIQTLVNYEIFGHILHKTFDTKYQLIYQFENGGIYQNCESGAFFLNIDEEYYPESNIVQEHYDTRNKYLYFDGGDVFFIFDVQKNTLIEFDAEFENVTEVDGKHYILLQSPTAENPTQNIIYCIEDEIETKKCIHRNSGYILKVFTYRSEIYSVISSEFEYIGFQAGERGVKLGNSTKIEKLGVKIPFIEQEGIFRNIRIFGDDICLITEKRDFYEKDGKLINSFTEIIEFYDCDGNKNGRGLSIPIHRIKEKIETPRDTSYIVEHDPGKLDIFSLGLGISLSSVSGMFPSKITEIVKDTHGVLIYFIYPNGKKGFFASADYPNFHSH